MAEKERHEVAPCQNPQSLQKEQLWVQGKVHGLKWDAEVGCGGDRIWEGYNKSGQLTAVLRGN